MIICVEAPPSHIRNPMNSSVFDPFVGGNNDNVNVTRSDIDDGNCMNHESETCSGGDYSEPHPPMHNDDDSGNLLNIILDSSSSITATADATCSDAMGAAAVASSSNESKSLEIFGGKPGDGIISCNDQSTGENANASNNHGQASTISDQDIMVLLGGADTDAQQHDDQADIYNIKRSNLDNPNSADEWDDDEYDSQNEGDLIDMVGWDLRRRWNDDENEECAAPSHSYGVDKNTPTLNANAKGMRNATTNDRRQEKGSRLGLFGGWKSDRNTKAVEVDGGDDVTPISLTATSLSSSLSTPSWSNVSAAASNAPPASDSGGGRFFRRRGNNASSISIPPENSFIGGGDASYLKVPCDGIDEAALAYGEGGITGDTMDHHSVYDGESDVNNIVSGEDSAEEEEDKSLDNRLRVGDHIYVWQSYGINPRAYQRHAVVFSVTKRLDGESPRDEDEGGISFDIGTLYSNQEDGHDVEVTVVSFYHFQQYHASHGAARAQQAASGDRRGKRSGCKRESLEEFIGQDGWKKQKPVNKVRYGRKVKKGLLSQKAGVGTALKKDEVGLILARVQYLLDHPDHLPNHSALSANGECASLWCVTGRWCTLQGASILAITSVGQAGGALLAGGILSNLTILVPMPGVWGMAGWWWYVPATVAYPFLVPMLVALGMASLVPLEILRRNRKKWRGITDGLNHQFWSDTSDAIKEEYFGVMATAEKQAEMRSFFGVRDGDVSTSDDARYMPVGGTPGEPDGSDDDEDEAVAIQKMEMNCQHIATDMNVDVDLSGRPPSKERPKGGGGWGSFISSLTKKEIALLPPPTDVNTNTNTQYLPNQNQLNDVDQINWSSSTMNSIPSNNDGFDEDESAGGSSSVRVERLRERTQRHRERLHRAKQFHQNSQQQQSQQQLQQEEQQEAQQKSHRRTSSDSSGSISTASSLRRGPVGAAATNSNAPPPKQPQQLSIQKLDPPKSSPVASRRSSNTQNAADLASQVASSVISENTLVAASAASAKPKSQQTIQQQQQQQPIQKQYNQPPPYKQTPPYPTTHRAGPVLVSVESPLPPLVQRSLGDRSFDKRKNAALEIEQLVKSLNEAHNGPMISSIIAVLAKDFCTSMNANYRKGGLIGIAATAIGLTGNARSHLDGLLFPVLQCFDDPESRVRYYACESLYNISKVARGSILRYFNQIFDGLTKLFADVDVDVKNGANLLDRLIKDIVTESETFHVEHFLPLLTTYIRRTNPYIRQLLVGWITVLDSVPDISMIDYLPDFLDGLFNMLSDSNREIRQAADSALSDFLKEVKHATVIEFGPIVSILVNQSLSKDRLNRLTAITWIEELIHHPYSGGDVFLPHHAEVLSAILYCISDSEEQICLVAERTNADLLSLVRDTHGDFRLAPLLETLTDKIMTKDDVPTKMASLRWINMLLEKRRRDMTEFVSQLLPILLKTLSDASDAVVLFTLQVLARISLGDGGGPLNEDCSPPVQSNGEEDEGKHESISYGGLLFGEKDEKHFKLVVNSVLGLFASDRMLLENRGSLVVRKFCVLLDAESVYILMAEVLSHSCDVGLGGVGPKQENFGAGGVENSSSCPDADDDGAQVKFPIEFVSTMVQTLNLILLTANELHGLRVLLAHAIEPTGDRDTMETEPADEHIGTRKSVQVFEALFRCWCHSPVSIFSLCLLARAYGVAFALVQKFSELEVTVGFLMQIDKLVQLLESPVFVHLRLQLLDVESPHHAPLLKSCYGLLMLLPQSDAFRILSDRLTTVCNLRDNLGIPPIISCATNSRMGVISNRQQDLLSHFDKKMDLHRKMRGREIHHSMAGELLHSGVGRVRTSSSASASFKGTGRPAAGQTPAVLHTSSEHGASSAGTPPAFNRGRITQEV